MLSSRGCDLLWKKFRIWAGERHYGADRTPPAGVGGGGGPLARVLYMREKARGHSHNVCYGEFAHDGFGGHALRATTLARDGRKRWPHPEYVRMAFPRPKPHPRLPWPYPEKPPA
jgi:hypothetical protein